ncbi:AAA family ATPase [Pseudovibrio ascidiaceicola]|uniref:AAA family ATPase n=1 Tax=Pseudovibrio ascidiaceicola TaxID=285279 RepID=UPI003D36CC7A
MTTPQSVDAKARTFTEEDLYRLSSRAISEKNGTLAYQALDKLEHTSRSPELRSLASHLKDPLHKLLPPKPALPQVPDDIPSGLDVVNNKVLLDDVILPDSVKVLINEFIEEQNYFEQYAKAGIAPKRTMLLCGPPGNGKTEVAKAIATVRQLPMYIANYPDIKTGSAGATGKIVEGIFNYAATHECILFLDEIDAGAKKRGSTASDEADSLVSAMLVQLDKLPKNVICLAATNLPDDLDPAIWRRFSNRIEIANPTADLQLIYLRQRFEKFNISVATDLEIVITRLDAQNLSELNEFVTDLRRRMIREGTQKSIAELLELEIVNWPYRRRVQTD